MMRILRKGGVTTSAMVTVPGPTMSVIGVDGTVDMDVAFDDPEGWLADREGRGSDQSEDAAKRVVRAWVPGRRKDVAIVHVHGVSASRWEIRPVPERVGKAIGNAGVASVHDDGSRGYSGRCDLRVRRYRA